jgi:hypothetical protein
MRMSRMRNMSLAVASVVALGFAQQAAAEGPPTLQLAADMVRGVQKDGNTGAPCVLNNQFKRREEVVWRIRVVDPKTGDALDDKGIKSLVVEMADGQKFPAHFGGHPPPKPVDHFWTAIWVIPESYPTGSFGYKLVATDLNGQASTWEPFKTKPSQLAVVPGTVEFVK